MIKTEDGSDIEFVLNAHGPSFEIYSMICIKSIIFACKNPRIKVFRPTNLPQISRGTKDFYERNSVEVVDFHNDFLPDFLANPKAVPARHLTLNKLYCLQGMRPADRRLFLDADTLVMVDPRPKLASLKSLVACPPVDTPEAFGGDWRKLYEAMNIDFPSKRLLGWERYAYGKEKLGPMIEMVPYFCSGVVYADGRSQLPDVWKQICRRLEENLDLIPKSYFLDQIALSVALHATREDWTELSRSYNCHFETLGVVDEVRILHYLNFDALSAVIARRPEIRVRCREIFNALAVEDGVDMRFRVLTEWPRKWRRLIGIIQERFLPDFWKRAAKPRQ